MDTTGTSTSIATAKDTDIVLRTLQEELENSRLYIMRLAVARGAIRAAQADATGVHATDLQDAGVLFNEQIMQPALRMFNQAVDAYYNHLRRLTVTP